MILFGLSQMANAKKLENRLMAMRCMALILVVSSLVACTTTPAPSKQAGGLAKSSKSGVSLAQVQAEGDGREVVMYALGLLDVGYQFGGKNPEAGLDCSGMVRFIYKEAVGLNLPHNAAEIAKKAKSVSRGELRGGDLVFFNTRGFAFSHVGIYLGDDKFIHAPSSKGRIRVESLSNPYYAQRFLGGRTLLAGG